MNVQNFKYGMVFTFIMLIFSSLAYGAVKFAENTTTTLYSITCTENGEVVFEAENQKRSFGFDGRTRQVHIYDNYSLSKTITFTDETSCEQTYTHARTNS